MSVTEPVSRRPQGLARERALLDSLATLLEEQAFAEIDVRAITERAGVARSGFYFYFPTKAAAVAALLEEIGEEFVAAGVAWYDDGLAEPADRVARGMQATVAAWRAHPRLLIALADASATDQVAASAWRGWHERFVDQAAERISRDPAITMTEGSDATRAIAAVLVDMTTAAMLRDLRHLLATGEPLPDVESAIVHVWSHALYS